MNLSSLFMVGLPADNDLSFVREFQPGGVILMGRNARPFAQVQELCAGLRETLNSPMIASDHEGGRVQRLKDGFAALPPAREVSERGVDNVRRVAQLVGQELSTAGLNLNFAPVCDVPIHQSDTVIRTRAFSTDFTEAGLFASAYSHGLQSEKVGACAKHFPGHGGVGIDSHFGLPIFPGTREELDSQLMPFRAVIAAGVSSVMVAHIAVPALDATGSPASLSYPVITGLLRKELGFDGLVVSDDLEMGALDELGAGEISIRALNAGCDLLLFCHSSEKAMAGRIAVEHALDSGRLASERVEEALAHVEQWKNRFAR